ncbi:MAG TPA: hypothetical protein VFO85_10665, partial [Vicinamibacteria bacterium]|nr:hypothetical protein [Vicinamibacteria bacterium]
SEPVSQAPAPAARQVPLSPASSPAAPMTPRMGADRGFWNVASAAVPPRVTPEGAAPAPALPTPAPQPEVAPQPPPVVRGRWTGYVTDDLCRAKGAARDHGQCLETCLRRGRQPLISIDGELYQLVGLERIRGLHDRRVVVEGQLDLRRRALVVTAGWPAQ